MGPERLQGERGREGTEGLFDEEFAALESRTAVGGKGRRSADECAQCDDVDLLHMISVYRFSLQRAEKCE